MAEVDTSSYLKPGAPKSALENAIGYGQLQSTVNNNQLQQQALQSGAIGIDKDKLALVNTQMGLMANELSAMSDGNFTKEQAAERLQRYAKTHGMPEPVVNQMMQELQQSPDVKTYSDMNLRRMMTVQERLNRQYGGGTVADTGDQLQPGVTASPAAGGGFTPAGPPINKQLPVGQPTVDNRQGSPTFGQPGVVGPRGPAFGSPPVNPQVPSLKGAVAQPAPASQPGFIPTGAPPLYDEGKKLFNADQELATQKLTNAKPALLALDLLPGLRSGPGTDTWNKAVAGLKANGIISTDKANDPTAVYQEVDKYLNQYLKGRGDRSDADLQQAAKSSPNPGTQINPALLKLTQTAVAQDRIEAARAAAFKGNDFQNYGKHRSEFPAGQDERAFIVDKMTPDQKQELAKDLKKMKPEERARFVRSLKTFEDSKVSGQ